MPTIGISKTTERENSWPSYDPNLVYHTTNRINPGRVVNRFYIVSLGVQQFELEGEKFVCLCSSLNKDSAFITKILQALQKEKKRKLTKNSMFPTNRLRLILTEKGKLFKPPINGNKIAAN